MSQCRLEKLQDYYWYPTVGIQWAGRTMFTVLFIRGTDDLLRFTEKREAQEFIDKWVEQGMERLPDVYSLPFELKKNLNSDFT